MVGKSPQMQLSPQTRKESSRNKRKRTKCLTTMGWGSGSFNTSLDLCQKPPCSFPETWTGLTKPVRAGRVRNGCRVLVAVPDEMRNDLVRDPAGVAADPRRIKSHRAVIAAGFRRLNRSAGWMRGRRRQPCPLP